MIRPALPEYENSSTTQDSARSRRTSSAAASASTPPSTPRGCTTTAATQIEIFVYDLTEDPAGIVDAEEERIALSELDSDLVPTLLSFQRDDDLVLLAVADAANTARLRC